VGAGGLPQRHAPRDDSLSRVGIVAALATEARALTSSIRHHRVPFALDDGSLLVISGIGGTAAAAAATALVKQGADALISFGLAGGLDPSLKAGSIFLPTEIFAADGVRYSTSNAWRHRVAIALDPLKPRTDGRLLSSVAAITAVEAKRATFRETGALAVDMESAAVAQIAAAREMPFIAARVIVDTAVDELPNSVIAASSSGKLRMWHLLASLARAPAELADFVRLARRFRAARMALRAVGKSPSLRQAVEQ
jgi:adenosylhomocysteine nucleosidase